MREDHRRTRTHTFSLKFRLPTSYVVSWIGSRAGVIKTGWETRVRPPLLSPTTVELRCSRENGLLSPALSSKGGEGEDHEKTWAKCLNSTAVPPAFVGLWRGEQGEGEYSRCF